MAEQETAEQSSWVQRNKTRIATVAAVMVAAGGAYAVSKEPSRESIPSAEIKQTKIKPSISEHPTVKEMEQATEVDYRLEGFTAGVFPPTPDQIDYFNLFFLDYKDGRSTDPPVLRETIFLRDSVLAPVEAKFPRSAPIYIFNGTDRPVNVPFIRFVVEATQEWLAHNEAHSLDLNSDVSVHVEPEVTPHTIIQVDHVPSGIGRNTDAHNNVDVTRVNRTQTTSWIVPSHPGEINGRYLSNKGIATEICQALIHVYIPTVKNEDFAAEERVEEGADFNVRAMTNLRLAAQEEVCNGLGGTLAALYTHGLRGVESLVSQRGFKQDEPEKDRWPNYGLYASSLENFYQIMEKVKKHSGIIEVVKGNNSPTIKHYR